MIDEYWLSQQQEILAKLSGESLVVAGDGRCDSPGTCAKYCSYTLMDTETMMVVHTTTVDKREVRSLISWTQFCNGESNHSRDCY